MAIATVPASIGSKEPSGELGGTTGRRPKTDLTGRPRRLDPLRFALVSLTVMTIGKAHLLVPVLAVFRPALLLVLVGLAFAVLMPSAINADNVRRQWHSKALVALAVIACLSIPFGISPGNAGRYFIQSYSKVLVFGFLLILSMRDGTDLRRYAWAYAVGVAILSWHSKVLGISKMQGVWGFDANDAGLVLVVGVPFVLSLLHIAKGRHRIVLMGILGAVAYTVSRSESRGAFVGLVAVGVMLLFTVQSVKLGKRVAAVVVVSLALVVGAPQGYWKLIGSIADPKEDYNWDTENGRRQLALRGIGYMVRYPVFGLGLGNFPRAEGTISEKLEGKAAGAGVRWAATHNSHIQIASELGITGLAIWISIWLGSLIGLFKLGRRLPPHWARGDPEQRTVYHLTQYLPSAIVGFLVSGTFLSFAYNDLPYFLIAMTAGIHIVARKRMALEERARAGVDTRSRGARIRHRNDGRSADASRARVLPPVLRPPLLHGPGARP